MKERIYCPVEIEKFGKCNKCGVYQIRNRVTNKVYVGSSKKLEERKNSHFRELRKGCHSNAHLQNSFIKYGEENFIFEIIEFCKLEERFDIEQYWIDKFFRKNCYNINPEAVNPPDMTGISKAQKKRFQNSEVRKKHSEIRRGKNTGALHVNSIPVVCLETGLEYAGQSEAARETGCNHSRISACCNGKGKTANGLHWVFKSDYIKMSKEDIEEVMFTSNRSIQVVCLETRKCYKKVIDAMSDTGGIRDSIIDCCKGTMEEAKGLHWVYYEDYKKMSEKDIKRKLRRHTRAYRKCKCIETQQIFSTISSAARALNLSDSKICLVCSGKRRTTGGLHFEYM